MGDDAEHPRSTGDGPVAGQPSPDASLPGPSPAVLELAGLTKSFGATAALRGVDVAFRAGSVRAIVGENGAGKSTLLSIIAGHVRADPPSQMRLLGRTLDLAAHDPRAARAAGLALVPQELAVVEPMSVAENIFLGREPRRGPILRRGEMRRRAAGLLERLGTSIRVDEPVERLSVAQLQLVEIAKALSRDSRFLAFDEPSAVLSGEELDALFRVIHQLAGQGVAIAYVSHRLDEIFQHCDTFTVLKDGETVAHGPVAGISREQLVRAMVGRDVSESFPPRATRTGATRLEVRDLAVAGKLAAIDLDVRAGEIVGIAGLMGSGRTTLAKAIFGALPVSAGSVRVDDVAGPFRSPRAALHAGLAYLPEDRRREGLATSKSVATNLSLLALRSMRGGPLGLVSTSAERERVGRRIEELAIRTRSDGSEPTMRLSGGNQQKVVLGKWLEVEPRVLILDEPTRGIDVGTKEEIYRVIRALAAGGLAVLVISSELIEVLGLSDRIEVMADGRITGSLIAAEASEEDVMRLATMAAPAGA